MHYLLRVALSASLLLIISSQPPLHAEYLATQSITKDLERALNKKDISTFKAIAPQEDVLDLASRYKILLGIFPNANWEIKEVNHLKNGREVLKVSLTGDKIIKGEKYTLEAIQLIRVKTLGNKIIEKEVLDEQAIIQNSSSPLSISINVPSAVLTGTTYDFDIILNKPLGETMIVGGLIPITTEQIKRQISPPIELAPLGGGGLFKSVKAPLQPGVQNWAALIAHPKGLISITKMVRIVELESEIKL